MRRLQGFLSVIVPLSVIFALYLVAGGSPASAVTVNFNACPAGQNQTYTESGLTVASPPFPLHMHCENKGGDATMDLLNHPPAGFHNYTFTFSGGTFDLVSLEVVAANQAATFTNNLGGTATIPAATGIFNFPSGWTGITSAVWSQNGTASDDSQFLAIDNLVFQPTQVNGQVPEPSAALLMTLGLLGIVGKRRTKPVAA